MSPMVQLLHSLSLFLLGIIRGFLLLKAEPWTVICDVHQTFIIEPNDLVDPKIHSEIPNCCTMKIRHFRV